MTLDSGLLFWATLYIVNCMICASTYDFLSYVVYRSTLRTTKIINRQLYILNTMTVTL